MESHPDPIPKQSILPGSKFGYKVFAMVV